MSRGTRKRGIRIEDDLWADALAVAQARGDILAVVIRDRVTLYVEENRDLMPPTPAQDEPATT